jgi:hypothetical protein
MIEGLLWGRTEEREPLGDELGSRLATTLAPVQLSSGDHHE